MAFPERQGGERRPVREIEQVPGERRVGLRLEPGERLGPRRHGHRHLAAAASDGRRQPARCIARKDERRAPGRLLEGLEKRVRGRLVHRLRRRDDRDPRPFGGQGETVDELAHGPDRYDGLSLRGLDPKEVGVASGVQEMTGATRAARLGPPSGTEDGAGEPNRESALADAARSVQEQPMGRPASVKHGFDP